MRRLAHEVWEELLFMVLSLRSLPWRRGVPYVCEWSAKHPNLADLMNLAPREPGGFSDPYSSHCEIGNSR